MPVSFSPTASCNGTVDMHGQPLSPSCGWEGPYSDDLFHTGCPKCHGGYVFLGDTWVPNAAHRWIPVSERLPEPEEVVLAYGFPSTLMLLAWWQNGPSENHPWVASPGWYDYGSDYTAAIMGITHWLPLPEAPKALIDSKERTLWETLIEEND